MKQSELRALIVEDDPSWQDILSELLNDAGLIVDIAGDLETAIAALKQASHRLAIVDLSLEGSDHHNQDGLQILDAARQFDPGCTTVLLTGYATVELAVSVLTDYGAYTCLRKETFQRAAFRNVVQEVLASSVPWKSAAAASPHTALQLSMPAADAPQPQMKTAIIVEDDAGWRGILSELLEEAGYSVRQCTGFGEALGCFNRERFDLAVVDLSLSSTSFPKAGTGSSEMNGFKLLETAQEKGSPTIVVSGITSSSQIKSIYEQFNVFACLEKQNFDRRAFLKTVEELHQSSLAEHELTVLTGREREVLGLLARGLTNKEIAETLVIAPNTVKRHLKSVFEKLDVHTRSAAAAIAIKNGLRES